MPAINLTDEQVTVLRRRLPQLVLSVQDERDAKSIAAQPRERRIARVDAQTLSSVLALLQV